MILSQRTAIGIMTLLALATGSAHAQSVEIPVNEGFVTDHVGVLTSEQEESLEQNLSQYAAQTSNEIAVLFIHTLSGADIMEAGVDIFRSTPWSLGQEDKNNGILLLVAYDDREVGITTGYGLEGAVPDLVAKGIIDTDITPAFREGKYYEGVLAGVEALKKHIGGEYTAERYRQDEGGGGIGAWIFFLLFIGIDWLAALFARSKSWWLGGVVGAVLGIVLTILYAWWISIPVLVLIGLFFDYIMSRHGPMRGGRRGGYRGPGGSWGGGSSRGGGFGGFGGGSTGGGGAHGRW